MMKTSTYFKKIAIISFLLFLGYKNSRAQTSTTLYPFNTEFATGYVRDDGKNFSGDMVDIAGNIYGTGYEANSGFVTFDLTALPEGAQIVSAELILFPLGSGTTIGNTGFAHATALSLAPMNGIKVTKKEINKGEIYAENLDWAATIIAPISSALNAAGVAALNKKIGSFITLGIDPPKSTDNVRSIAGYNATSTTTGQKPQLNITYNTGSKTKPSADFNMNTRDTFATTKVTFFDNSGGYPSSWFWDFGDSSNSTERNPQHAYLDTGVYSVKLVAVNAQGKDSIIKTNVIRIRETPGPAIAEFGTNFRNVNATDDVTFIDLSTGVVDGWKWYFGDGDSSMESGPVHAYANDGKYSVTLIISGPFGGDTILKNEYINVGNPVAIPQANFSYDRQSSFIFKFNDQSKKFPESWSWDFGDGIISTKENPVHDFMQEGNYEVCLVAENLAGRDTVCKNLSLNAIGIRENARNIFKINVHPNPFQKNIYFDNIFSKVNEIIIYNSIGTQVYRYNNIATKEINIDLTYLQSGMYHLLIKSDGEIQSQKIIKL